MGLPYQQAPRQFASTGGFQRQDGAVDPSYFCGHSSERHSWNNPLHKAKLIASLRWPFFSASLGPYAAEQAQRPVVPPCPRLPAYHPLETSQESRPIQALVTCTETPTGRHLGTVPHPDLVRIHRRLLRHHPQGTRWAVDQSQLVPGWTRIVDVTPGRSLWGTRRGSQDVSGSDGDRAQIRSNGVRLVICHLFRDFRSSRWVIQGACKCNLLHDELMLAFVIHIPSALFFFRRVFRSWKSCTATLVAVFEGVATLMQSGSSR